MGPIIIPSDSVVLGNGDVSILVPDYRQLPATSLPYFCASTMRRVKRVMVLTVLYIFNSCAKIFKRA